MPGCRAKLRSMQRLWYAVLLLLLHSLLLYSACCRYSRHRQLALRQEWSHGAMNLYLGAIVAAASLLLLFLYAAFAGDGNFAEEGASVGGDSVGAQTVLEDAAAPPSCLRTVCRLAPPLTCLLHLCAAFCLLLPLPALRATVAQHGEATSGRQLRSNLDFLLNSESTDTSPVSPEWLNLALALALLLSRCTSIYWFTSRRFALLLSLLLLTWCAQCGLAAEATSLLVLWPQCRLPAVASVALVPLSDLLLLLSIVGHCDFGYGQLLRSVRRLRRSLQLESASNCGSGCSSCGGGSCGGGQRGSCWQLHGAQALAALAAAAGAGCKVPLLWHWILLFRHSRHPVPLAAVAAFGAFAVAWTLAWATLCCRGAEWQFRIRQQQLGKLAAGGCCQDDSRPTTESELSRRSNQYLYMQRVGEEISMVPTISEQVDSVSESSYCGDDRQCGLVKYQVRQAGGAGLKRSSSSGGGSVGRAPGRVTFKDAQESAGSPNSSQNTSSSDSGIDANRQLPTSALIGHRMTGSLYAQEPTYSSRSELYSLPPPPTDEEFGVPDILMTRSQLLQHATSFAAPPPPTPPPPPPPPPPQSEMDVHFDGLCSQV